MGTVPPHLQPILEPDCGEARRSHAGGNLAARLSLRMGYRLALLASIAALFGLMFLGQTVSAPDWLRDRVAARLEQTMAGRSIAFGDMRFVIRKGWRPRLGLSDVHVADAAGLPLLDLSRAEVSLAMRPLMQGILSPKKITLQGARATLRRGADGAVALEYGTDGRVREEAASLPALIESWEDLLLTEPLLGLTEFELTDLTLRYDDARSGRSWTVDDGRLVLHRHGDTLNLSGSVAVLSGRSYAAALEMRYDSSIPSRAATFGITVTDMAAEDIATQSAALGWLEPLRAPISGAVRGGIGEDGKVLPLSATLRIGAGVLQPTDATRPIPFRSARSYFTYDPDDQVLTFDELSVDSAWGSGSAEGRAYLAGLEAGRLTELVGQFSVGQVRLNPAGLYGDPLVLSGADSDFRLRLSPFEVTLGQGRIRDGDTVLTLDGRAAAKEDGWDVALNGRFAQIGIDRLLQLWPVAAAPKPRAWIARNVTSGRFSDVDWALRGHSGRKPDIYVDFEFAGATVQFAPALPPLTGARGHGSLAGRRLAVTATDGAVLPDEGGPVQAAGSTFIIPDIGARPATPAVVRVTASGTPTAALSLLNRPPLSVLGTSGLPVALADGRFDVEGVLALPMQARVTLDDMKFHAGGRLRDVSSDVLVPGHVLSARELAVTADDRAVEIAGAGEISGIPATARWRQPLGAAGRRGSRAEGDIELSARAVEAFRLGLPADFVSGRGTGRFDLTLAPSGPRLHLISDLDGVGLALPALGWRKPPDSTGTFEAEAKLGRQPEVTALTLRASGLAARGRVTTRADGELDRASFTNVRLRDWLNVRAELRGRGAGALPEIRILGGRFDLDKATLGDSGGGPSPPLTVVALDRLQISDGIALTGLAGDFRTTGGLSGTFSGNVNGGAPVTGRVAPQDGSSAFEITSKDAGGVFRDAGIITQARDGDMNLKLVPAVGVPGEYDGSLRVTDTNVIDAPAIAALVNAISVVGLFDELSGKGIVFNEVDARFRLGPRKLLLASSSAIGPSIGLSMDGTFDLDSRQLDMQGVISPFYVLNAIGSVLTRKGEGLIGFSFNLRGAAADPRVAVNPLSALTPGLLREIFRKPVPVVGKSANGVDEAPPDKPGKPRREVPKGEDR